MGWKDVEEESGKSAQAKARFALRRDHEVKLQDGDWVVYLLVGDPIKTASHWINGRTVECDGGLCCVHHGKPTVKFILPGIGVIDESEKPKRFYTTLSTDTVKGVGKVWQDKTPSAVVVSREGSGLEDTEYKVYPDRSDRYTGAALEKPRRILDELQAALATAYPSQAPAGSSSAPPPVDDDLPAAGGGGRRRPPAEGEKVGPGTVLDRVKVKGRGRQEKPTDAGDDDLTPPGEPAIGAGEKAGGDT